MQNVFRLILLVICILAVTGCDMTYSSVPDDPLYNVKLCDNLTRAECDFSQSIFPPTTSVFFLTANVSDPQENDAVKIEWSFLGNDYIPVTKIDQAVIVISRDEENMVQFSLSKPHNDWPVGIYQAQLLRNGDNSKTLEFEVIEQ